MNYAEFNKRMSAATTEAEVEAVYEALRKDLDYLERGTFADAPKARTCRKLGKD